MRPTENHRSFLYAAMIATAARPMSREDFECGKCGREHFSCECFTLPNHQGSGAPSLTSGPVSEEAAE
jgi:hypothetical protein